MCGITSTQPRSGFFFNENVFFLLVQWPFHSLNVLNVVQALEVCGPLQPKVIRMNRGFVVQL